MLCPHCFSDSRDSWVTLQESLFTSLPWGQASTTLAHPDTLDWKAASCLSGLTGGTVITQPLYEDGRMNLGAEVSASQVKGLFSSFNLLLAESY